MKKVTVIDYLIERLHEIGVDDIFGGSRGLQLIIFR